MNSYIGVIDKLDSFCKEHGMIRRFGSDFVEQMSNFATLSEEFPIVFVAPVSKVLGENLHTYTIDIYCWDIIQKDRGNVNTCLSDTDLILTDIWTYFYDGDDYTINVIGTPNITPINNGLLDYTVGNIMRLNIEVDSYCSDAVPIKNK